MLKISISIEFVPSPAFSRWAGMVILALHWMGFL